MIQFRPKLALICFEFLPTMQRSLLKIDAHNTTRLLHMNGFQVKRILRWQEKRESPSPEKVLPFSPSSYHIPKTETQKIGPQEMADSATALSACVCVEHSLLLELAKYAIFSKTKPQNKILKNEAEGIASTTTVQHHQQVWCPFLCF